MKRKMSSRWANVVPTEICTKGVKMKGCCTKGRKVFLRTILYLYNPTLWTFWLLKRRHRQCQHRFQLLWGPIFNLYSFKRQPTMSSCHSLYNLRVHCLATKFHRSTHPHQTFWAQSQEAAVPCSVVWTPRHRSLRQNARNLMNVFSSKGFHQFIVFSTLSVN